MDLKKIVGFSLLFFSCAFMLSAQFSADPNDPMYGDLEIWEARGLISRLPVMRPYPPQVVRELLARVAERGNPAEAEKAKAYLDEISKDFTWHIEAGGTVRTTTDDHYLDVYGVVEAGGWLSDSIHVEGRAKGLAMDNTSGFVLPKGQRPGFDIFDTWADVTVSGRDLFLRQNQNVNFAAGGADLYFQAGIIRNSFGPFWGDGVVLSADAPHTGHYSFVWRNEWFAYSTALLELAATNYLWSDIDERYPDKHLVIQSFNFYPADWLELGYFESIMWGGRMDLNYLLPFKELFYSQSMAGFEDNSFVGLMADVRVAKNVKLPFILYLDDTNLNDLLRFDLSTKFKVAAQAGVKWAPEKAGALKMVVADYVMVTPYMYTHRAALDRGTDLTALLPAERLELLSMPNYNNYTHSGTNLGVGLEPNSDRLSLQVKLEPAKNLKVTLTGRYMRHGNASEDMIAAGSADLRNDGTILDDGYDENVEPTFHYDTKFLTQDEIEKTLQAGFQVQYSMPFWFGTLLVEGGYMFENVDNYMYIPGRDAYNRGDGVLHYFSFGMGFRY